MANYLATIRGTLASAALQEMFVHSFAVISSATVDTVANALAQHWTDCLNTAGFAGLKAVFGPGVVYNEVTAANIINAEPPDPRLSTATHVAIGPIVGTGGNPQLPSQCALAVSVKAGLKPNGVPAKGRFYLPTPAGAVLDATTGQLAAGVADNVQECIADFWANMNLAGHRPALWSRTRGTVVPWDSIRVGNKIDTIRRRRNELPEVYTLEVTVPG